MSSENSYYVPEQSKLPLAAAASMGLMAYGAASWVIDGGTSTIFLIGTLIMASVMYRRKYSGHRE
jgi:cytochrome c oxidase subunit III